MKYRNAEKYYQKSLDDVGTKDITFDLKDPISAMRLNLSGTNGSASNKSNFINDVITKIEIVDGSDQLFSLSMKEAQAIQQRRTKKMPHMRPGELNSGKQEESVLILFGRHLWDKEYYLDLTKHKAPQIKITTNIAAIRAAAADAFVSNSLKATIDLMLMEEGAEASKGFMMHKNIRAFTSATSGDEPTDLPGDFPYVGMLIRAHATMKDFDENISNVKIDCDTGKFVPLEKYAKDLYRWEEEDLGPAELRYYLFRKNGETIKHPINHDPIVSLEPWAAKRITGALNSWSGQLELFLYDDTGAAITTEEMIGLIVKGSCLHSTVYIPFGKEQEPDTYFDPKKWSDIKLILTQAAASAVSICMVQLRSYAAAAA